MKIYTDFVPVSSQTYLTAGKHYDAIRREKSNLYNIVDDQGEGILVYLSNCSHLNGQPWNIVDESEEQR